MSPIIINALWFAGGVASGVIGLLVVINYEILRGL